MCNFFQGDMKKVYEELSDFLLQMVQEQSLNLSNKAHKLSQEDQAISVSPELCSADDRL